MKSRSVIKGAFILTIASIITRCIGFVFRVYISNTLGAEGMGIYQLVLSIYSVGITVATSGMSTAVSKLVAEQIGNPPYMKKILKVSTAISISLGAAAALFLLTQARFIGANILRDERTIETIRILALGLPFISAGSCLRGYFIARRAVYKPATMQIIEQLTKIVISMLLIPVLFPFGLKFALLAVVIGMTGGEIISCAIAAAMYNWGHEKAKTAYKKSVLRDILYISVPIALGSYLMSFLHMAENMLIPFSLQKSGLNAANALSIYGMLKGMVMPLLFFPSVFMSALSSVLVPTVSAQKAANSRHRLTDTASSALHLTMFIGILIVGLFISFPYEIGVAVYKRSEVGQMLKLLSFICPFMYLEMVTVGILSGLGQYKSSLKYSVFDSLIRISLIYFLMPVYGIKVYFWVIVISNMFTSLLNLRRLLTTTHISFNLKNWLIKPSLCTVASGIASRAAYQYIYTNLSSMNTSMLAAAFIMVLVYLLLNILASSFPKKIIV